MSSRVPGTSYKVSKLGGQLGTHHLSARYTVFWVLEMGCLQVGLPLVGSGE